VGLGLVSGTIITTGEQSDAVLDLGAANAAYLESDTAMTVLRIAAAGQGTEADLQLDAGRLLVIMPGGRARLTTPLAQIDLVGGAALIEFRPGKLGLVDSSVTISCLATVCTVNSRIFGGDLTRREQMSFSNSGLSVDQTQLSEAQVSTLLDELQYGASVAATLSAWPAGAATAYAVTATGTQATAAPALPTRTLAPILSTATPTLAPSGTSTGTSTATSTSTTTPTPTTRRIRPSTWTPTPTMTASATNPPPTPTPTDTARPQTHQPPSTTVPASATPIPPSQTPPPSSTSVPPSATQVPPPTKTPVPPPTKTPPTP
jgi:hypothetical protein